jgi:hypothetical protein
LIAPSITDASDQSDTLRRIFLAAFLEGQSERQSWAIQARLQQLERDISAIGFSEEDVKQNDFAYGETRSTASKTYLVVPPDWWAKDNK